MITSSYVSFHQDKQFLYANKKKKDITLFLQRSNKISILLTDQIGKDQTTISKLCTNSSQPDLGNLMQIAKIFDVELTDLVRFEEFKNAGTD